MEEQDRQKTRQRETDSLHSTANARHIGGINSQLGGVDPEVDQNLMRLAGGPD